MTPNKTKSRTIDWLLERISHTGDECLIWPFGKIDTGYGQLQYDGKIRKAHRVMCLFAHGEPPTPKHQAAHECGRGQFGCVNPRHLAWKTPSENQLDRRKHGTAITNPWGRCGKLSDSAKAEILKLKGRMTQRQIAAKFNCHFQTVSRIHNAAPR